MSQISGFIKKECVPDIPDVMVPNDAVKHDGVWRGSNLCL
jgi:hypothetical protein